MTLSLLLSSLQTPSLDAIFPSPQSLQSCITNSIRYAIPISFIINVIYTLGILKTFAKSFILSIIKPSLNITDVNIITPVSMPINTYLSLLLNKVRLI